MEKKERRTNQKDVKMMTTRVQKWGNSLAIRIPRNIAEQIDIVQGTEIELRVENQGITLKPKKK